MAANNAIASTQKINEGDAFVFDNSGANRNIGMLAQQKAQEAAREQQEKLLKQKQDYDTEKQFIDKLTSINTLGIRTADLPVINEEIDGLLNTVVDAKMQGKNPLDIGNTKEYMELQTRLGKVQAKIDASKTWQKQLIASEQALKQDKDGKLDYGKTMEAIKRGYTNPFEQMVGYNVEPVLAEFSITPRLDKMYGNDLKTLNSQAKVLFDQGAVDDVNKMLDSKKQPYIQAAIVAAGPEITQGRITVDKVIEDAGKDFDLKVGKAFYADNKDNELAFKKSKQAEDLALKKARLRFDQDKEQYARKVKETTPTYVFQELGRTILSEGSNEVFNGLNYYDTNLGVTKKDGSIVYPTINKIEKRIYNPDGTIDALVSLNKPEIDDAGNISYKRFDKKVNAFDAEGNPVYQNSQLYNSIQEQAARSGKSYSNISGQEVGSGKPNVTPTTAKNNPGFKGQNNNPNPKTTTPTNIPVITTKAQFDALPKGSSFIRNGETYKKE